MTKAKALVSLPGGWPEDAPPRAAFFGLAPAGYNGGSYEDLASYFRRLSACHGIRPRSLAYRAVVPLFAKQTTRNQDWLADTCHDLNMNGLAGLAEDWVGALERLTLRSDLHLRTLLPLRGLVPSFALISKRERFCAQCYRDDELANRQMYNRLLWSIGCVEACPLHGTLLLAVPCTSQVGMRLFSLPGISRIDGSSLSSAPSSRASAEQIMSARLVAELLDDVHHNADVFTNCHPSGTFLRYAINTLFDGKAEYLAKHLGVNKSELHGWTTGKIRPSLPRLVLIAYCCGCGVSDALLGNKVKLRKVRRNSTTKRLSNKARTGSARPQEELRAELEQLVESGTASTLRSAARLLDISEKYLRRMAPDIASIIVAIGKEARHTASVQRADIRFEHFRQSFQHLSVGGVHPSRREVVKHVYLQTGIKLGFDDAGKFLRGIRQVPGEGCN
jgi:transcriptional regulator with XRE-family HTH domain